MNLWELVEKPSVRELQEMAKIQEKALLALTKFKRLVR